MTKAGEADYAEWFGFLSAPSLSGIEDKIGVSAEVEKQMNEKAQCAKRSDERQIQAGDVVQLRSPEQKITLDTSHPDCGPILVVSTSPSVAAGKPKDKYVLPHPHPLSLSPIASSVYLWSVQR